MLTDGVFVVDIVHMTCHSVADSAQSDLCPIAELLFNTSTSEDGLLHGFICDTRLSFSQK